MEKKDLLEKFVDFLKEFYQNELALALNEGTKFIAVDFSQLEKFEVDLADYLLENPEEVLAVAEEAVAQVDTGLPETKIKIRFYNLPENRQIRIRTIRAEHIGKMIAVEGLVKRASDVRPEVSEAI